MLKTMSISVKLKNQWHFLHKIFLIKVQNIRASKWNKGEITFRIVFVKRNNVNISGANFRIILSKTILLIFHVLL